MFTLSRDQLKEIDLPTALGFYHFYNDAFTFLYAILNIQYIVVNLFNLLCHKTPELSPEHCTRGLHFTYFFF